MNEQYLRGLHGHLNIKDDYDTWVGSVSGNEQYLRGLHGHLGVKDDYETWYSSVWGEEQVKKKEEFESASEEDFLVYTPTSGQADIDLGSSSIEEGIPSEAEQEALSLASLYQFGNSGEYPLKESDEEPTDEASLFNVVKGSLRNVADNVLGTKYAMTSMAAGQVREVLEVLGAENAAENLKSVEAFNALKFNASEVRNQEYKKNQQVKFGVSEENTGKTTSELISDGNYEDAAKKFGVEATYAVADAIRTYAPFIAGSGPGAAFIGLDVMSKEYARRVLFDPTLSNSQKLAYAATNGVVEAGASFLAAGVAKAGAGRAFGEVGEKLFGGAKEAAKKFSYTGNKLVRDVVGEGFEEGVVSAINQVTDIMYDSAFKGSYESFNVYEVLDGAIYGMTAGGVISGGTSLVPLPSSARVPHSKVAEDKQKIDAELKDMVADYRDETNPDIKKAKYQRLQEKFAAFDAINGAGADAYATLNQDEAVQVRALNSRIAQLQDQINSGKDLAGIEYNPEQLAEKKAEMEKLYGVKKEIEGKAFSREYAEDNQGQLPLFVEDAEGNQVETQAKVTPQNVTEQHRTLEKEEVTAEDEQQASTFELDTEAMAEERSGGFSEFDVDGMTLEGFTEANIPTTFHEELMTSKAASENALRLSGTKVVFHEPDSFAKNIHGLDTAQEMVDKGDFSFGYFDPENNTIHLYDYTQLDYTDSNIKVDNISDTVRHEFIHAGLSSIIGQDADSRSRLYGELETLAETDEKFKSVLDNVKRRYPEADTKQLQEEAIREFLQDYSQNPSKYKGRVQRIIDAIKSVFTKYNVNLQVNDETDLMNLAKKFDSAIRTKRSLDIKTEQQAQTRREGRASKPFTYLQQAQIYYTFSPAAGKGDVSLFTVDRMAPRGETVKVNDYGHFKNWYNKMTGNGRVNSITNMYHIVDGKRRAIKPPKPRLNKDGSVMHIDLPLSPMQRRMEAAKKKREAEVERIKAVNAARTEAFRVMDEFGLDFSRMPLRDFIPREEGMTAEEFRRLPETAEGFEAAVRNMQALMESGFDPKESFKKYFDRDKNIDLYTMAEADYVTPQEQMVDDLTKPDSDGEPRSIGGGRFSKPDIKVRSLSAEAEQTINQAVESGRAKRISKDDMDGKAFKAYGYDKTLNGFFGSVNIGDHFSVSLNSGVNNTGILSSASAERGKSLQGDIVKSIEEAKAQGLDELMIIYTAQDEQYITGNPQVFDVSVDFVLDYLNRIASESEQEKVNGLQHTRLKNFLQRSGEIKYIRGSETEPGVVEALRVALPKMMAESNNPEYLDLLERYDIGENKKHKKLVLPGRESEKYNPNDINTLRLAIKDLGQSRKIGEYLSDLRSKYKKIRDKKKKKGEVSYLENFFGFRIALVDALMSPADGFYADGHPSKQYEGLKNKQGKAIGAKDLKSFFVNPMLKDFKPGEIMAVKVIKLTEGQSFKVEDNSEGDSIKAFSFEIVQEGADAESSLVMIPEDRYHYLDFDSDKVISLFEGYYDEAILNIADELGINIDEVKNSELYKASRSKAAEVAKEKALGALSRIGQSGFSGITQFGPQFSMLKGMKKREMVSPDRHISNAGQVNMEGRFSQPDFVDTQTDQGDTWKVRTRTSTQMWTDKWLTRLQDKYRGVFLLQEDVETFKGRTVKESEDFKLAEETMYGKAANDLRFLDERIEQITSSMKDSKVTSDEISEYLYALHAEERNKVIEERTEGDVKDGSGISTEEANEILESYSEEKRAQLDDIVSLIREMQQDTRDTMVKFGLETQEAIDAFESMFSNYIPLSGLATDEESSVTSAYPTGGAGLSVFGDQTKRAKGRKTRAENVLAQAVAQNASVHIEARKNEAMNALYKLVKNNPNPEAWSVIDNANALDPHVVPVRVDGEQKFIRFRDASYANALKNMNVPQTNQFIRLLRAPSTWLRAAFTTQNPEFILSNFSRDIQSAVFNAAAESEIEGGFLNGERAMRDLFNKVGPSLKALLRGATGREQKADPTIMRYYEEYQADGGKTGWAYMKPLDEIAAELEGSAEEKTRTQEILGKAKNVLDFVEGVNDAFENSIRLASYIAARENGVSRAKAAQFAKNITVNFNKHGEWGQTLNAVYLFFNASVQGTARLGRSLTGLKSPVKPDGSERTWYERTTTAQKMAGGLTLFSGMLTMLGMAMSDEDEDGELYWTKIPDYVKERNLIIMRPDGKNYFKIPMPYGYNVFANMGTAAVEGAAGTRDFASGSMFVASSFINSFSPISFGQSKDLSTKALKSVIPTPLKPMVDIATNETYFGSPVYSKRWDDSVPASSMSFRSPESVKSFFSWLNDATGGSQEVPGAIDMNPDKLWYGIEYFMGGPGLFVERTSKTVRRMNARVVNKEDVDIAFNDVPMLRIIYGEPSKYYDMEKYADRKNLIKGLYNEVQRTGDNRDPRYKGVFALKEAYLETDREIKKLRNRRKEARNIKDFGKRTAEIQRLMDLERKQIMRFNKYYSELRED